MMMMMMVMMYVRYQLIVRVHCAVIDVVTCCICAAVMTERCIVSSLMKSLLNQALDTYRAAAQTSRWTTTYVHEFCTCS